MAIMKRFLLPALCAFAALSLFAPESQAQTPANGSGTGTSTSTGALHRGGAAEGVEKRAREIIAKYDRDGDHALNATELAAFFEAVHQRVEEHRSQSGTASAASTTVTRPEAHTPLEHAQKAIAKFDKNGDGKLEARELAAMLIALREKMIEHRGAGTGRGGPAPATPTTPQS